MKTNALHYCLRFRRFTASCLAVALLAVTACTRSPEFSTTAAGHAITADIKGNGAKVETLPERGVLGSEFGQVTIERSRMRGGEQAWVKISGNVPVAVAIRRGKIALKAVGVSVAQTVSNGTNFLRSLAALGEKTNGPTLISQENSIE